MFKFMITSLHDSALVPSSSFFCVFGTGEPTKKDEFLEKFHTAFDPPPFGPFSENSSVLVASPAP